jgi:hypothetical protein
LKKLSSDKLNKMLHDKKYSSNKSGLSFMDNYSSMPSTSGVKNVCTTKVMFVSVSSDKGKKIILMYLDISLGLCTLLLNNILKGLFLLVIIWAKLVILDITISG